MDAADHAALYEQRQRELAIDAHRRSQRQTQPSATHCHACGVAIPQARRAFGGVRHCINCARNLESRPPGHRSQP